MVKAPLKVRSTDTAGARGFKRTEVGPIPDDWEVDTIGALAKIRTGARNTQDRKRDGEYPFFVRSQQVERIDTCGFDGEAVLTAGDGVGTGKVFHYIKGPFDFHQRVYKISDFSRRLNGYYFFIYFSSHFFKRISAMTAKSSVDSVRMDMIADMPIALPSVREQEAIAMAVWDVEASIDALDNLIAKKRAMKLGAMQELLFGRTRLPGFTGEWQPKRFGDLLRVRHGRSQSDVASVNGPYPIMATGGEIGRAKHFLYDKPSVLIGRKGTIDRPQFIEKPFWSIDTLFYTEIGPAADPKFLFYRFCMVDWRALNEASGVPSLSASNIEKYLFSCPEPKEQRAVAEALTDMDTEIEALNLRRTKIGDVKTGIVQTLLSGRVRLPLTKVTA